MQDLLDACCAWYRPVFTEATNQMTFQYRVLANATDLMSEGGAVDSYVDKNGTFSTLPYIVPGSTAFYNARCAMGNRSLDCISLWDPAVHWASCASVASGLFLKTSSQNHGVDRSPACSTNDLCLLRAVLACPPACGCQKDQIHAAGTHAWH